MTGRSASSTVAENLNAARRRLLRQAASLPLLGLEAMWSQVSPQRQILRLGLSDSLIADVNPADARAAMSVWIKRLTSGLDVELQIDPGIFEPADQLLGKLRTGQMDTLAVTVGEYRRITEYLDPKEIVVQTQKGKLEYVLLVRSDAADKGIAQLRGKRLVMLKSVQTLVAPAWLANLVSAEEAGGPERFFGSITLEAKPSQVVLPVFFGRADACLTTGLSFATMCEMNPQVGLRLRPLAVSPEIVASLYAFRKGWASRTRELVVRALSDLRSSAAGRQVLALFQCDSLVVLPTAHLKPTLAILDQYEKSGRKFSGIPRREEHV